MTTSHDARPRARSDDGPFVSPRSRAPVAGAGPGAGADRGQRREPARHQDPRRQAGARAASAAGGPRHRPGRRRCEAVGAGVDALPRRRRGLRHDGRRRRPAGLAGGVRRRRRRPAGAQAGQPVDARGGRAAAGRHHRVGRPRRPRRRCAPARRCWCTAAPAASATSRCRSPRRSAPSVRDRLGRAGRHHRAVSARRRSTTRDDGRRLRRRSTRAARASTWSTTPSAARCSTRRSARSRLRRPRRQRLGWGTHALAPLSFRAATYSGVFTLLPMLTGQGRAHHGADPGEAAQAGRGRPAAAADGSAPLHARHGAGRARGSRRRPGPRQDRGRRARLTWRGGLSRACRTGSYGVRVRHGHGSGAGARRHREELHALRCAIEFRSKCDSDDWPSSATQCEQLTAGTSCSTTRAPPSSTRCMMPCAVTLRPSAVVMRHHGCSTRYSALASSSSSGVTVVTVAPVSTMKASGRPPPSATGA